MWFLENILLPDLALQPTFTQDGTKVITRSQFNPF